jgi:uncharacterized protein
MRLEAIQLSLTTTHAIAGQWRSICLAAGLAMAQAQTVQAAEPRLSATADEEVTSTIGSALTGHPSLYLAMHADDPVAWQDWGPRVLEQAQIQDKPLYLSSGYFACHWCHVMQSESFRDPVIAALINAHFIPVKIDRELHAALDGYLIGFTERTAGTSGWPLNVVLTPAGHPLVGFTYLPPDEFRGVLARVRDAWDERRLELADLARAGAEEYAALRSGALDDPNLGSQPADWPDIDALLLARTDAVADRLAGGFGSQARFPREPQLEALMDLLERSGDEDLAVFLRLTFDAMANGALRDHLSGGFFRYTVDPDWRTPHFEKMLYNQAQLVPLYLRAAERFNEARYLSIARETLDFMVEAMRTESGGFAASLSALDADGVEGGAYLWDEDTLADLLDEDDRLLADRVWGLSGASSFDAGHLPLGARSAEQVAESVGMTAEQANTAMTRIRDRLGDARKRRLIPRDEKQLAGWNGLTLSALAAGVATFDDPSHRAAGEALRNFLAGRLWDGEQLHRARSGDDWIGTPGLEDLAYVAVGLADWARVVDDPAALALSQRLVELAWRDFRSEAGWRSEQSPLLPAIPAEAALPDTALPSPSAILLRLALAHPNPAMRAEARATLPEVVRSVVRDPFSHATAVKHLGERHLNEIREAAEGR